MAGDWLKLHRKLADSIVMSDDWLCRLWISCLLRAGWRERYFSGHPIPPGSFAFTFRQWCELLGVSRSKLESGLNRLESIGSITRNPRQHFTVVTICKWESYQDESDDIRDAGRTLARPPAGRQPDADEHTKEESKELKEGEEGFTPPEGSGDLIDQELLDWCHWWNGLRAEGLVPAKVETEPPSGEVVRGWRRLKKSASLRALCADKDAIATAIRSSPFCQEPWFRLEKVLGGKNRDGALIVKRLLDGGYASGNRTPVRRPNSATYDPDAASKNPDIGIF